MRLRKASNENKIKEQWEKKSELLCVCLPQIWQLTTVLLYLLGTDLSVPDAQGLETERGYLRAKPLVRGQSQPQKIERCWAWEESQSKMLGHWCFVKIQESLRG